jgi:hypothetical protein
VAFVGIVWIVLCGVACAGGVAEIPDMPVAVEGSVEVPAVEAAPALARIDRQERVRPPDEVALETIELVDAQDAGLVRRDGELDVLTLTQAPCRFVENEPDAQFEASSAIGCRKFSYEALPTRGQRALRVAAGRWRIEVHNAGTGRDLGFWLRREDDGFTVVSAGGIASDARGMYVVDLAAGRYLYSCPLNPTPSYLLVVQ